MQNVVVATDLTPTSEPAIERAAFAGQVLDAGVHLMHVLPEPLPPFFGSARAEKAERALRYRTRSLDHRFGPRTSCNLVQGDRSRCIVRESEEMDAVLTVFGRNTRRRNARRLVGTVPERSLKLIRNAALIVCDDSPKQMTYRKALLAPDGGVGRDALMPHLHRLAPDATVHSMDPECHGKDWKSVQKAADYVRAMRRALDADLLVIGMPWNESINPLKFRRLLTPLVRMPECDTLIVPQECDVVPLTTSDPSRESVRIRAAS